MSDKSPIKFYRLTYNYWIWYSGTKYSKGRIFYWWYNEMNKPVVSMIATAKEKHSCGGFSYLVEEMRKRGCIEEIQFDEIQKLKPHWNKEFKNILKKFNLI